METIIVGEIGLNANGDINIAKQLIDVCSDLNIPYVKFQKRDITSCYTKEFLDSPRESPWGKTQRDQKEGLELSLEQYQEIDMYCKGKGNIEWFASPWDMQSIAFLESNFPNIPFLKISSAKITDMHFLGCTSSYPCPTKDINLNQLKFLSHYFRTPTCAIGWSDHSGGILFPTLSVAYGAKMVEVHITMDRRMYGSDQASSIEPQGLRKLVKYIEEIELGLGEPNKVVQESEIPIIKKLRGVK